MNSQELIKILQSLPKSTEVGIQETNKIKVCLVSAGKQPQVIICGKLDERFTKEIKLK